MAIPPVEVRRSTRLPARSIVIVDKIDPATWITARTIAAEFGSSEDPANWKMVAVYEN